MFEVPEARATLILSEPPYAGAEIDACMTLSPAIYFATQQWMGQIRDEDATVEDIARACDELSAFFIAHARPSWNLSRNGELLPVDEMRTLGLDLIVLIVRAWLDRIGTVPVPLPETPPVGPEPTGAQATKPPSSTATSQTGASRRRRSTPKATSASSSVFAPG